MFLKNSGHGLQQQDPSSLDLRERLVQASQVQCNDAFPTFKKTYATEFVLKLQEKLRIAHWWQTYQLAESFFSGQQQSAVALMMYITFPPQEIITWTGTDAKADLSGRFRGTHRTGKTWARIVDELGGPGALALLGKDEICDGWVNELSDTDLDVWFNLILENHPWIRDTGRVVLESIGPSLIFGNKRLRSELTIEVVSESEIKEGPYSNHDRWHTLFRPVQPQALVEDDAREALSDGCIANYHPPSSSGYNVPQSNVYHSVPQSNAVQDDTSASVSRTAAYRHPNINYGVPQSNVYSSIPQSNAVRNETSVSGGQIAPCSYPNYGYGVPQNIMYHSVPQSNAVRNETSAPVSYMTPHYYPNSSYGVPQSNAVQNNTDASISQMAPHYYPNPNCVIPQSSTAHNTTSASVLGSGHIYPLDYRSLLQSRRFSALFQHFIGGCDHTFIANITTLTKRYISEIIIAAERAKIDVRNPTALSHFACIIDPKEIR